MLSNQEVITGKDSPQASVAAPWILLIDDDPVVVKTLCHVLETGGYHVWGAAGVPEARRALAVHIPDIIICDVVLPQCNGLEFHAEVRENPAWHSIPFLFLSALCSNKDIRAAKEIGADDYLTKPCDPADLLAAIAGKLKMANTRRQMAAEQLNLCRKRIIHTLSHEFRTPLVSINTGTELLLEQHSDLAQEQISRLLRSIWRGGQRLERLVDDFMVLQQIDLGQAQHICDIYRRKSSLLDLVQSAIDCFPQSYQELGNLSLALANPAITAELDLYVYVYDLQVISIVQRLLHNACKFGGNQGPISINIAKEQERAVLSIRDYGPGMDNLEVSARNACEAFVQINRETNEQQGCGLGLAICNYLARINGGNLFLRKPAEGPGLEAAIDFPVAA